jgi:hypothetical protein
MVSRARAFAAGNWPPLAAAASTLVYATATLGFGLNFRPLHHDEGVTLSVASEASAPDVLHTAIDVRHGPPLHYLVVHASLWWRDDVLGLRLPSALLGILAVALAYGAGRELLGRSGAAVMTVVVAASPIMIHLGQFARGYTAMISAAFGSLWLLLVLLRTRRRRWIVPYALSALLLVSAHPFGLFALASEVCLMVVFGLAPQLRAWRRESLHWRTLAPVGAALVLALAALAALHAVYAPLQTKYGVGHGGPVVELGSSRFWDRLGGHAFGSDLHGSAALLGIAVVAGALVLWFTNRRAAVVVTIWLALPLLALQVLTASSPDFAPERHLSFLMPGYAVALAALLTAVGRRGRRLWPAAAVVLGAGLLAPGIVAGANELRTFSTGLRDASLALQSQFGSSDEFLASAGTAEPGEQARLYATYAVLAATDDSWLGRWRQTDPGPGCSLVHQVEQRAAPTRVWILARPPDPDTLAARLRATGATAQLYGAFVLASAAVPRQTPKNVLFVGSRLWAAAFQAQPNVPDFHRTAVAYRQALRLDREGLC